MSVSLDIKLMFKQNYCFLDAAKKKGENRKVFDSKIKINHNSNFHLNPAPFF